MLLEQKKKTNKNKKCITEAREHSVLISFFSKEKFRLLHIKPKNRKSPMLLPSWWVTYISVENIIYILIRRDSPICKWWVYHFWGPSELKRENKQIDTIEHISHSKRSHTVYILINLIAFLSPFRFATISLALSFCSVVLVKCFCESFCIYIYMCVSSRWWFSRMIHLKPNSNNPMWLKKTT